MKRVQSRFEGKGLGYAATQGAAKVFGLLTLLAFAASSSSPELGVYATVSLVASAAYLLMDFGCSTATLRAAALDSARGAMPPQSWRRVTTYLLLGLSSAIAGFAAQSGVALASMTLAIGSSLATNAIFEGYFLGVSRPFFGGLPNLIFNGTTVILAGTALLVGRTLVAIDLVRIFWLGAASANVVNLLLQRIARKGDNPAIEGYDRKIARRSFGTSTAIFAATQADLTVAASLGTRFEFGIYSIGQRIANAAAAIPQILTTAQQRSVFRAVESGEIEGATRLLHARVLLITSLVSASVSFVCVFAIPRFGSGYSGLAELLPIMMVAVPIYAYQASALVLSRAVPSKVFSSSLSFVAFTLQGIVVLVASATGYFVFGLTGMVLMRGLADIIGYSFIITVVCRRAGSVGFFCPPLPLAVLTCSLVYCQQWPSATAAVLGNCILAAVVLPRSRLLPSVPR